VGHPGPDGGGHRCRPGGHGPPHLRRPRSPCPVSLRHRPMRAAGDSSRGLLTGGYSSRHHRTLRQLGRTRPQCLIEGDAFSLRSRIRRAAPTDQPTAAPASAALGRSDPAPRLRHRRHAEHRGPTMLFVPLQQRRATSRGAGFGTWPPSNPRVIIARSDIGRQRCGPHRRRPCTPIGVHR
jgi:hypothetical protein